MKLYKDKDENFYYVETNGSWYETPYEEEDWKEIPAIKHPDHAELIKCDLYEIDYPEFITDCHDCNNSGYLSHDEDGVELCDCYHAMDGYENAINKNIERIEMMEDYEETIAMERHYGLID